MKHSLKRAVASLLCASLLGGAAFMMGCATAATTERNTMMSDRTYSFSMLSSEKPEVKTAIPISYMDLTTRYSFAGPVHVTYEVTEGSHTTFTATGDDPVVNLYTPEFKPSECKSIAIIYRTDMNKDGESTRRKRGGCISKELLFCGKAATVSMRSAISPKKDTNHGTI